MRAPIESLFRLSFGNAMIFETEFFPKLANFKNTMLSLDFKNSLKYGSCSPATNIYFNDRTIAEDRGIEFFGGIRFRHTDYLQQSRHCIFRRKNNCNRKMAQHELSSQRNYFYNAAQRLRFSLRRQAGIYF